MNLSWTSMLSVAESVQRRLSISVREDSMMTLVSVIVMRGGLGKRNWFVRASLAHTGILRCVLV